MFCSTSVVGKYSAAVESPDGREVYYAKENAPEQTESDLMLVENFS